MQKACTDKGKIHPGEVMPICSIKHVELEASKRRYKGRLCFPRQLWPDSWVKAGYRQPMTLLVRSLYGHPEAGGHWERHLEKAIGACFRKAHGRAPVLLLVCARRTAAHGLRGRLVVVRAKDQTW